jgi:hypothetical protein
MAIVWIFTIQIIFLSFKQYTAPYYQPYIVPLSESLHIFLVANRKSRMPFIACIRNTPPELSYIMAGLEYIDSSLQLLFHGMFDPILSLHLQFHKII